MPTWRAFKKKAFLCGLYEAQDVLAEVDSVDFIEIEAGTGFETLKEWQRRILYHDITRRCAFLNPGLRKVRLAKDYELFIAVCQDSWDLVYLNAIEGWRDRCKTTVCWLDEIWAHSLHSYRYLLAALDAFDYVFVGTSGSVECLSKAINKQCRWLPGAVDTIRFSPAPAVMPRVVDVYSIGRRWDGMHQALLRAAEGREIFYVYDTFGGANMETLHPRQHRELFANITKRSNFFVVAPPKMDMATHTGGQVEVGYRYFEGAAAGAVMVGQRPDCEAFSQMFPWADAVLEVSPDGSDIREALHAMRADPERLLAVSERNTREALLRHDWVYRWRDLLTLAGAEPSPLLAEREKRLQDMTAVYASRH